MSDFGQMDPRVLDYLDRRIRGEQLAPGMEIDKQLAQRGVNPEMSYRDFFAGSSLEPRPAPAPRPAPRPRMTREPSPWDPYLEAVHGAAVTSEMPAIPVEDLEPIPPHLRDPGSVFSREHFEGKYPNLIGVDRTKLPPDALEFYMQQARNRPIRFDPEIITPSR